MNRIRRTLTALGTLAGALPAFTAGAPAAFASHMPPQCVLVGLVGCGAAPPRRRANLRALIASATI